LEGCGKFRVGVTVPAKNRNDSREEAGLFPSLGIDRDILKKRRERIFPKPWYRTYVLGDKKL
jgi:hypothetical protein